MLGAGLIRQLVGKHAVAAVHPMHREWQWGQGLNHRVAHVAPAEQGHGVQGGQQPGAQAAAILRRYRFKEQVHTPPATLPQARPQRHFAAPRFGGGGQLGLSRGDGGPLQMAAADGADDLVRKDGHPSTALPWHRALPVLDRHQDGWAMAQALTTSERISGQGCHAGGFSCRGRWSNSTG